MTMKRWSMVIAVLLAAGRLRALTVSSVFSDHAVLQAGVPVPIWGAAAPGERITVTLSGRQPVTVRAGNNGRWLARLAPMGPSSVAATLVIAGHERIALSDVVVGEVWLCGGQSNMDFRLARVEEAPQELAQANFPSVRQLLVARNPQPTEATDVAAHWSVCSPALAGEFTAVGYYFARRLSRDLGVPIGLLFSSYGNTPIEAWMGQAAIQDARRAGLTLAPPRAPFQAPSVLFNGMIHPLIPYALRGLLWYQGESNAGFADSYPRLEAAMVADWRRVFGQGDLPFFWVQLPNLRSHFPNETSSADWVALREAQSLARPLIPRSGEVIALDLGDPDQIHPGRKQAVGERLALLALKRAYGRPVVAEGPSLCRAVRDGDGVRLRFSGTDGGLVLRGGSAGFASFELAGRDGIYHECTGAVVSGDSLVLCCSGARDPLTVRYAHRSDPVVSLFNRAGLPAGPFRSTITAP